MGPEFVCRVHCKSQELSSLWLDWDDSEFTASPDTRFHFGAAWAPETLCSGTLSHSPKSEPPPVAECPPSTSLGAPAACYGPCAQACLPGPNISRGQCSCSRT